MTKNLRGNCQHCGGLIEFSAEHAGETAPCPHCHQSTALLLAAPPQERSPLQTRAIVFISLALLILIGGVVGAQLAIKRAERIAGRNAKPATVGPASTNPFAPSGFQVTAVTIERATNSTLIYAVGTVSEIARRKRFGVRVELALFDREGRPCGSAKDYQATLEAGSSWQFRAMVLNSQAARAEVTALKEDK